MESSAPSVWTDSRSPSLGSTILVVGCSNVRVGGFWFNISLFIEIWWTTLWMENSSESKIMVWRGTSPLRYSASNGAGSSRSGRVADALYSYPSAVVSSKIFGGFSLFGKFLNQDRWNRSMFFISRAWSRVLFAAWSEWRSELWSSTMGCSSSPSWPNPGVTPFSWSHDSSRGRDEKRRWK